MSAKNLHNILNTTLSHCLCWDLDSLPTSQPESRYSSFTVNFPVAHELTGLLGPRLTSNPKNTQWKTACGETDPSQGMEYTERSPVSPLARDTAAHWSLQMDEGRRTGLVGRTHIGALYWTSFSTYLWHSPPSSPFRFPPVHTYAFEAPRPGAASFFSPIFLVCSVKTPAKLIQPPQNLRVFWTVWMYRALHQWEWARSERKSVFQREE